MSRLLANQSIEVSAHITTVFSYAANLENFPAWFPGVLSIQARDSLAVDEVGKAYDEVVSMPFGRSAKVRIQVVEAENPTRLATEGDFQLLLPRMELDFQPVGGDKTRVEWRMYSRRSGVLAGLMLPILRFALMSRSRRALTELKGLLEGK